MRTLVRVNPPITEAQGGFITVDGIYHKIKKAFKTIDGVYNLLWSTGPDIATMGISYTGTMTDKVVTMSGVQYRLLELKKSGTLTIDQEVNAEVWMCSGGAKGGNGSATDMTDIDWSAKGGKGGNGGKFIQYTTTLAKSTVVTVGAAAGVSQVGDIKSTSTGCITASGGGGGGNNTKSGVSHGGGGAKSKGDTRPFADSYFTKYPCAGGGGGSARWSSSVYYGGSGGSSTTAGTGGANATKPAQGGTTGGGKGAYYSSAATAATYYGSGGGGGHGEDGTKYSAGASGYQGIVYIRIPIEQSA